jgi:hypothetical protein
MHRDSALFYQEEGKYTQAISYTNKAIELYKKIVPVYDTSYSRLLKLQVENHYYAGLHKKGLEFAKADSIWCEQNNNVTGTIYTHLGMLC